MTRRAHDSETDPATGSRDRSNKALDAFIGKKAEIDAMLARLQGLSDDHFNTDPDAVHWGDVGTLSHYSSLLRQITDIAFNGGEHAA